MRVFVVDDQIFNTFIDDVFAFVIEMPLKHRLMTLRDDVWIQSYSDSRVSSVRFTL